MYLINQLAGNEDLATTYIQHNFWSGGIGKRGSDVNDCIDSYDVFQRHGTADFTGASRTFYSGLQVRGDQVVNSHGGKPIAKKLVAFANASNVMAPHRTDNNFRGEHQKGFLYTRTPEQYNLLAEVRQLRANQRSQKHQ